MFHSRRAGRGTWSAAYTETILKAIDQARWRDKDMVQVFVKQQEEDLFRLRYSGGSKIG